MLRNVCNNVWIIYHLGIVLVCVSQLVLFSATVITADDQQGSLLASLPRMVKDYFLFFSHLIQAILTHKTPKVD